MEIIYEDNNLLVIVKPAGIASQPDKIGDDNVITLLSRQCKTNIFPVHRLDRPVMGVMVFAKDSKTAAELANSNIKKKYIAILCGVASEQGNLTHYLLKNQRLNISRAVSENTPNSKKAILSYTKLEDVYNEQYGRLSKVLVNLVTGRHHQIRVQFAASGLPLWGDTKYNPQFARIHSFVEIGLCACSIEFTHPYTKEKMFYSASPSKAEPFNFFKTL